MQKARIGQAERKERDNDISASRITLPKHSSLSCRTETLRFQCLFRKILGKIHRSAAVTLEPKLVIAICVRVQASHHALGGGGEHRYLGGASCQSHVVRFFNSEVSRATVNG